MYLPRHSARLHLLRTPLFRTSDTHRALGSRFAWQVESEELAGDGPVRYATVYVLTPLGILHGLTGFVIRTERTASR